MKSTEDKEERGRVPVSCENIEGVFPLPQEGCTLGHPLPLADHMGQTGDRPIVMNGNQVSPLPDF